MNHRELTIGLYKHLLFRSPGEAELQHWSDKFEKQTGTAIGEFLGSKEYKQLHGVLPGHAPGHFYSPVVDPGTLSRKAIEDEANSITSIDGVEMRWPAQFEMWRAICAAPEIPYRRYHDKNGTYGTGDALILGGIINALRPRKVIEIGSGFSSARLLDAVEYLSLETSITFMEPYPSTLNALVTDEDWMKHRLIPKPVQAVDLSEFLALEKDDILFIDSTHVLKTGSDVHFEIFNILPALNKGVVVHFHDIFWPFEYPSDWIFARRYSWNELYLVRALLSHSNQYDIVFFNHAFCKLQQDTVLTSPAHAKSAVQNSPGGGLWLRKL